MKNTNITINDTINNASVLFGNVVETYTKENGWTCYTFGNAKKRAERVQIWYNNENGKVDIYMGVKTAWFSQYTMQAENAYSVSGHTPHAKGTELMWHLDTCVSADNMFRAWRERYGVASVKNAIKDSKESVKTA